MTTRHDHDHWIATTQCRSRLPLARPTRQAVPTDRLDAMLTRLQLAGIRDQLDSRLDEAARHDLSARETLALLCEREIARKNERRIELALKLAHFPCVRELSGFDSGSPDLPVEDCSQELSCSAATHFAVGPRLLAQALTAMLDPCSTAFSA
jgi:hypothetical protein